MGSWRGLVVERLADLVRNFGQQETAFGEGCFE